MGTVQKGYNLLLKVTNPTVFSGLIGATTSNSFDVKAVTSERLTKDDMGVKRTTSDNHEFEFSAEGFVLVNDAGEVTSQMDRDTMMDVLIAGTELAFSYGPFVASGSYVRSGTCVVTSYSEKSDAENDGTFSVSFRGISNLTKEYYVDV